MDDNDKAFQILDALRGLFANRKFREGYSNTEYFFTEKEIIRKIAIFLDMPNPNVGHIDEIIKFVLSKE